MSKRPWHNYIDVFLVAIVIAVFVSACCFIIRITMLCGFVASFVITALIFYKKISFEEYPRLRFFVDLFICFAIPSFIAGWLALLV